MKQHGHVIARTDYVADSRKSVTVVTSTWSSGEAGPLGICVPDGFMGQAEMESFNQQWLGQAFIFRSESVSHFMTSDTYLVLLHGLISPALSRQRQKLGVPATTKALLLCDGWTGFHSHKAGADTARLAWAEQAHCELPAVQEG